MNTYDVFTGVILPIVLVVITIVIIISLVLMTIKSTIKKENERVKKQLESDSRYSNIDTSIIYKEIDLSKIKDADMLKDNMFEMFKSILKAYSDMDNKSLKKFTGNSLYSFYLEKENKLKNNDETEIIKNIVLNDIRILDIKKKKDDYNIKFYLNINCYNYYVDSKKKRTIRGFDDRKIKQEYLVYLDKIDNKCIVSKVVKVGQKVLEKDKREKKRKKK